MEKSRESLAKRVHQEFSKAAEQVKISKLGVDKLKEMLISSPREFWKALEHVILLILPKYGVFPQVDKVLKMLRVFFVEIKQELTSNTEHLVVFTEIVLKAFKLLLPILDTKDTNCRLCSTRLIDTLLGLNLHNLTPLPISLQVSLMSKAKALLRDRSHRIRSISISMCEKLNLEEEILKTTIFDPIKNNRLKALESLNCQEANIKVICEKMMDPEYEIRNLAVLKVGIIGIPLLDTRSKRHLVYLAVADRYESIRKAANSVLNDYVNQYGLAELLKSIETETLLVKQQKELIIFVKDFAEGLEIEKIQSYLKIEYAPLVFMKTHDFDRLLICRIFSEALFKRKPDSLYFLFDPENLIELLSFHHPVIPYEFTHTVLNICMFLDINEEYIRRRLIEALRSVCLSYKIVVPSYKRSQVVENSYFRLLSNDTFFDSSADVISLSVKSIRDLLDQYIHEFPAIMSEILNEIRDPLDSVSPDSYQPLSFVVQKKDLSRKVALIDDEIEALSIEIDSAIERSDLKYARVLKNEFSKKTEEAEEIEKKLEEIQNEIISRLYRALIITTEVLKDIKHGVNILDIPELVKNIVVPAMEIDQEALQIVAVQCLTQCCLHSAEVCKDNLRYYRVILDKRSDSMLEFIVILSLFDMFMIWDMCKVEAESDIYYDETINALLKYLGSENCYIKSITLEGFCKLLLLNRVKSCIILSHIMIAYFDTELADFSKQILQVFFNNIGDALSIESELIVDSLKIVLSYQCEKYESQAVETIDFSIFNINKIFEFIWKELLENRQKHHKLNVKLDLLNYLLYEIVMKPSSFKSDIFSRLLLQFDLENFADDELLTLEIVLKKALIVMENDFLLKFKQNLNTLLAKTKGISYECKESAEILKKNYLKSVQLVNLFFANYSSDCSKRLKIDSNKRTAECVFGLDIKRLKIPLPR